MVHQFTAEQFSDVCSILKTAIATRLSFDVLNGLTDAELHFWVGLNNDQFAQILSETPSLGGDNNRPRTILGIYLSKLRSGESNERLATLFNMSRRTLERKLAVARESLTTFVDSHLGFNSISRDTILERNLLIPKSIFGNNQNSKAIVICDGTYIYIEKSSNFLFQRQTYSLHKFENLLKPFLIVCSDGYIIDVLGPYAAVTSDATIMAGIVNNEVSPLHWILEQGDVLILDRGFRDSIPALEECGYEGHIPPTKARGSSQLSTDEANKSRLITICRWVIEATNGRIKQCFKLLRQTYFNKALKHMFIDFRIAASLINAFHPVVVDNSHATEFIRIINSKINMPNLLYDYVELKSLNRQRAIFLRIDANHLFIDFPRMVENDIIMYALGTYHLKLSKSYVAEHLRDGVYIMEVCREDSLPDLQDCNIFLNNVWLLRGRIQSRHVRARTYYSYVLIDRERQGLDALVHHYCTCLTGRRTVGACAHVISIVWYLGVGRYDEFIPPALYLEEITVDNDFL